MFMPLAAIILATAFMATIRAFAARMSRRKASPALLSWLKSNGWPIFVGVWIIFAIAGLVAN
jgi:hypothetical protein